VTTVTEKCCKNTSKWVMGKHAFNQLYSSKIR